MATLFQPAPVGVDDVFQRLTLCRRIDALAIKAAAKPDPIALSKEARDGTEQAYAEVVTRLMAAAEADAFLRRKSDDLLLYWLMLMEKEETDEYLRVAAILGADVTPAEVVDFVKSRLDVLRDFPGRMRDALRKVAEKARQSGLGVKGVMEKVHEEAKRLEASEGQRLALCEAQVTYGSIQINALAQAGYKTKQWVTMGDARVRQSHVECGAHPPIPLDGVFPNGLSYPGDPDGDLDEIEGCRCWLIGGDK